MNDTEKELVNYNIYKYIDKNDGRNRPGAIVKSKFPRLIKRNQSHIIKLINENKNHVKFVGLLNNRDYFDKKAQQYLNDLEGGDVNGNNYDERPPSSSSSSSSSANSSREPTLIDPRFITNRYHAEQYIKNNILSNANKTNKLKQLMNDHFNLSDQWVKDRELISEKYNHDINNLQSDIESLNNEDETRKLATTKLQILEQKLQDLETSKLDELNKFDESVSFKSKKLSYESSSLLKELNLPFFNIAQVYKYPTLVKDQEYLIQFLIKQLQNR
ncbi:hypothetical protein DFJ63DRAFT_313187 [Scheffersomyces coipomensis]|uniref:uncharacterized protein n=1 Tax=Scheffersomyces coipomensis TaxID=1788519 RepID=UPI00315D622D